MSILVNFTRESLSTVACNFPIKLDVHRLQFYKNSPSSSMFHGISQKFSDQHFGSTMRGCTSLSQYEPEINHSVYNSRSFVNLKIDLTDIAI